ncbi:MAG TPA: hypothetical protein V6D17_14195 [Candidatus Obscuribacterales bacterium]
MTSKKAVAVAFALSLCIPLASGAQDKTVPDGGSAGEQSDGSGMRGGVRRGGNMFSQQGGSRFSQGGGLGKGGLGKGMLGRGGAGMFRGGMGRGDIPRPHMVLALPSLSQEQRQQIASIYEQMRRDVAPLIEQVRPRMAGGQAGGAAGLGLATKDDAASRNTTTDKSISLVNAKGQTLELGADPAANARPGMGTGGGDRLPSLGGVGQKIRAKRLVAWQKVKAILTPAQLEEVGKIQRGELTGPKQGAAEEGFSPPGEPAAIK